MAHFQAGCQGSRGAETRLGDKLGGAKAWVNGWSAGVSVRAVEREGEDEFDIFMTGGSGGGFRGHHIGTVRATKQGPKFIPVKKPKKAATG